MSLYYLNVTIHVLAALLWLGGMFFLAVVGAPALRAVEPPALRAELFRALGVRFRTAGWIAIVVLLVTGVFNLHFRGVLRADVLTNGAFWATPFGTALAWKLCAVALMILFSAVHDFVLGPRAGRQRPGTAAARRYRVGSAWLARLNAILGIVLVIAAVHLARGG